MEPERSEPQAATPNSIARLSGILNAWKAHRNRVQLEQASQKAREQLQRLHRRKKHLAGWPSS